MVAFCIVSTAVICVVGAEFTLRRQVLRTAKGFITEMSHSKPALLSLKMTIGIRAVGRLSTCAKQGNGLRHAICLEEKKTVEDFLLNATDVLDKWNIIADPKPIYIFLN